LPWLANVAAASGGSVSPAAAKSSVGVAHVVPI
jgi:hypothetical protein